MTYPFTDTWAPWHDVVFILALALIVVALVAVVQLVRMWRESRRQERARWERFLDRMWAESIEAYREAPFGATTRWDGEVRR